MSYRMPRWVYSLPLMMILAPLSFAQNQTPPNGPPPATQAKTKVDEAPSLAETMTFLQDNLGRDNAEGQVNGSSNVTVFMQDRNTGEYFNANHQIGVYQVIANEQQCSISYTWDDNYGVDRKPVARADGLLMWWPLVSHHDPKTLLLKDVANITVEGYEQYVTTDSARTGEPNLVASGTDPLLSTVVVQTQQGDVYAFPAVHLSVAERLAEALKRAVDACGGKR